MTPELALDIAKKVSQQMAYQYRQNPNDLLSHCHGHIPALLTRCNADRPESSQKAYVRSSLRGYCLHYLRDNLPLIRTPRSQKPVSFSSLIEDIRPTPEQDDILPVWAQECLEHRFFGRRFANAYLRFLDT